MSHAQRLVEVVARALADQPDRIAVTEAPHGRGVVLDLYMEPSDLGRVIGRQGRTATALRTLLAMAAERDGRRTELELRDWPPPSA